MFTMTDVKRLLPEAKEIQDEGDSISFLLGGKSGRTGDPIVNALLQTRLNLSNKHQLD